jgi:hypothetical protein
VSAGEKLEGYRQTDVTVFAGGLTLIHERYTPGTYNSTRVIILQVYKIQ